MWEWLLPIFGFLIGTAAALTGVGGGTFVVPLLSLVYGLAPTEAVGTSLATIIFTSVASTVNYLKQKRVYWIAGLVLAIATAPGAYIGSILTAVPMIKAWLGFIFGVFLIMVAAQMILRALARSEENRCTGKDPAFEKDLFRNWRKLAVGFVLSFFGGISSGLLGIGGGIVMVPIMCYALSFPIHFSIPTSMFVMIFTSTTGVFGHIQQGNVNAIYALYLGIGSVIGAQIGALTSRKLSSRNLNIVFAGMLSLASIIMILKNIGVIH